MTSVYGLVSALQTVLPWSPVGHKFTAGAADPLPATHAAAWLRGWSHSPQPPAWEALSALFLVSTLLCCSRKCLWI